MSQIMCVYLLSVYLKSYFFQCHNRIPLLLPEEVRKPLEYLTDSHVRDTVGIKDKKFVFASTGMLLVHVMH